ncbi:uncharacterized protein [Drosophila kikkawai]|uniref:Ribosome biogenesis protein NOP53 n=1 Tax=Drosophila kikkawai TaxID=30033 RepID=A0A6P4HYG2_DROKI|nr:uncharacterized protein LOC108073600 [Drosophila kikkawai]
MDLSLDEIIERKPGYGGRSANKKFNTGYTKPRKLLNRTPFQAMHSFDARNKIIQKTRAKIGDARDDDNWKIRDARQLLQDRKKNRSLLPLSGEIIDEEALPDRMPRLGRNDSRAGKVHFKRRTVMKRLAAWEEEDDDAVGLRGHNRSYTSSLIHSAKPFPPHGYVDHDNMQVVEDGEISS